MTDEVKQPAEINPYAAGEASIAADFGVFREPRLPTSVLAVTVLDMLLVLPRGFMSYGMIEEIFQHPAGSPDHLFTLAAVGLNYTIVTLAIFGGIGLFFHWRTGLQLQIVSLALVLLSLAVYFPVHLWMATEETLPQVALKVAIGGSIQLIWSWILVVSFQRTASYYRLIDSPRTSTAKDLARLGDAVMFEELSFADSPYVNDELMGHLVKHSWLARLDLSGTDLGDTGVRMLALLPKLAWLDLSNTQISDDTFASLASVRSLAELRVGGTRCTPQAAAAFEAERKNQPRLAATKVFL